MIGFIPTLQLKTSGAGLRARRAAHSLSAGTEARPTGFGLRDSNSRRLLRALGALALECGTSPHPIAVAFGVLTCDTLEQAQERADPGRADKGGEAALACLEQIHALRAAGAE